MTYTLTVTQTNNKAARFHYVVTDEAGSVISDRKSNREYVACTACGSFYFGRLDLIGKGDHGKAIKWAEGCGRNDNTYDKGGAYWGIGSQLRVSYTKDLAYINFYRATN